MQRENLLSVQRAKHTSIAEAWKRTRDRDRTKVPVVAVASEEGDLLVIHRADLHDLARRACELSPILGPL